MLKKKWLIPGILFLLIFIILIFAMISLSGISTPKVSVKISTTQLTEDNITLDITMEIENQNAYSLVLEDMSIEAITTQDTVIGSLSFPKKTIPAYETLTVKTSGSFGFKDQSLEEFESLITGSFGVYFYGITISLPLEISIITNPTPMVESIVLPTFLLEADITSINETGVLLNGNIQVENQNEFSMSLLNTQIVFDHNNTYLNAKITVDDTIIQPNSKSSILFSAFVGYEIFNIGKISASMLGDVDINVAGISLNRPFSTSAQMNVPDLAKFLMDNDRIEISLSADFDVTLTGLTMNVGFKLYNPTKIPLSASELDIRIYRVDNESQTLITEDILRNCQIPAKNETCLKSSYKLPLKSFLPIIGDGFPDWFLLTLTGDFIIANTNQCIPIQLNGYLNGNFFGSDTLNNDLFS